MKAEDTVMKDADIILRISEQFHGFDVEMDFDEAVTKIIKEAQAEISFKAGKESLLEEIKTGSISAGSLIHSAKKAGIKEVVNDLTYNLEHSTRGTRIARIEACLAKWRAKLKE